MAEFHEVMRQWVRARKATCGITGEYEHLSNLSLNLWNDGRIAQLEKEVMQWAAEHPEPVYPSIAKYLERFGIIIRRDGTLQTDFFKANEPMSADIAQKLGIEPKEG